MKHEFEAKFIKINVNDMREKLLSQGFKLVHPEIVKRVFAALGVDFDTALYGGIDGVYAHEIGLTSDIMCNLPIVTFDNPPKAG